VGGPMSHPTRQPVAANDSAISDHEGQE
jgi:hypothetical protein